MSGLGATADIGRRYGLDGSVAIVSHATPAVGVSGHGTHIRCVDKPYPDADAAQQDEAEPLSA